MSSLFRVACLAFLLAFSTLAPAGHLPGDELEAFPISRAAEPIVVPVTIGDKSYPFLVDSGSTFTVFDTSLVSLLGDEVERKTILTPAGQKEFQLARPKAASVGRLPLGKDSSVVLHDLTRLREASGLDIRGYLGMDFLSRHVVRIDFDRGRLTFLRSAGDGAGQRLPLRLEGGRAWVEARLAGAPSPEWFLLDTGHVGLDSGRLRPELISQLERAGKLRVVGVTKVETAGGRMEVKQGFLEALNLGQFEHKNLLFASTRDCNAFSLEFCARYVATFDFPGRAVYLRESSRHASPDQVGATGLALIRRGGKTLVEGVREGSPAAKAGLLKGDELLSLAGRNAREGCIVALGRLLCGSGRTVRVVIRRGEEIRDVSLNLDTAWRMPGKEN